MAGDAPGPGRSGLGVPEQVISDYERALPHVDLASINRRERRTLHDVKARIEEFNALVEAMSRCTRA